VTKSGKFGGRRDKYTVIEMTGKSIIYQNFSDFLEILEILPEILLGKLTFYH